MTGYRNGAPALALAIALGWLGGAGAPRPLAAQQAGGLPALERRVAALEAAGAAQQQVNAGQASQITALNTRLLVVEGKTAPISVSATTYAITGRNVFILDGSGATDGGTGLGNLTIGYNGLRGFGSTNVRTGTHNLVLGDRNNYSSYGGLVAGEFNAISNEYATITAGFNNVASGRRAAVSGGSYNEATNTGASVSGGSFGLAVGISATVSGGFLNRAEGDVATVGGGELRVAPGEKNWVAGGLFQAQ